jgi:hypothetical protein
MNLFAVRRARVRAEFAWLYPELAPGVWMSARKAARLVRQNRERHALRQAGPRALPELHFEFRGGERNRQTITGIWSPRSQELAS